MVYIHATSSGKLATEDLVAWDEKMNIPCAVPVEAFKPAIELAHRI